MYTTLKQSSFTLGLMFECDDDLFVFTHVRPISADEATAILSEHPTLKFREGWLWLDYKDGRSHEVCCSYECYCGENCGGIDNCGKWKVGLNRESLDDYLAAEMGIVDFLKLCSTESKFHLVDSWLTMHKDRPDLQPLD